MYRLLNVLCLLMLTGTAFAGDPVYPAFTIPAELKEKAHSVKRWEETTFSLTAGGEARLTEHYVITVLDSNGDDEAELTAFYDKLREIRSIRGVLYDALGKTVKKLKHSDITDESLTKAGTLAADNRIKRHSFNYNIYPYTVEYEIEMRYNNCSFLFPDWLPQDGSSMAVEQSRIIVTVPQNYQLRYRQYNYSGTPQITTEKDMRTYTWEIKGLKVPADEVLTPAWWRRTSGIRFAPSDFEMENYKGKMNTWEDFGKFVYTLNQGRDQLPETVKQTVHQLTDGLSSPSEKINKLYRYMQQNTRYVSIQLGIGGIQTFDAASVASKGYGDCKALSNYMYSLLKEAGIPSCYTLVHSGEGETDFDETFCSDQFDHVILCVPLGKDTTWLECTSQTLQPGYLSGFTANRPVLLVTEQGGKLVRTPVYKAEQNLQLRRIDAQLSPEGNLQAKISTRSTGEQQDAEHELFHSQSKEKIMEWIRTSLSLPSYDVAQYDYKEQEGALPAIDEQLSLTARNYASTSGKRMFLEPNVLAKSKSRITTETARRSDIHLPFAFKDEDTVNITLPAGYTPESIPKGTTLSTRFGTYTSTITVKDSTVTYIRITQHNAGDYPANTIGELEKFYDDIYKADRCRVVLVKKE
jgi:transglutaminase-like putative cysteine protease